MLSKKEEITKCPHCGSDKIRKAGFLPNGHQRYHCKNCNKKISALTETKYYQRTKYACPYCGSHLNKKAGRLKDGTIRRHCNNCGKGFSEKTVVRPPITEKCPFCESTNLRREGIRNGVQRYFCRDCNIVFTPNSQKSNFTKKKVQRDYQKGLAISQLAKTFNVTERTIKRYVQKCDHCEHYTKALENLPAKTKSLIIYYGIGANVSIKDMSYYFKVDKEVVKRVMENYKTIINKEEERS